MVLEYLALFSIGFVVGLSGAVIPGPLFVFTVFDTCRKDRVTGHFVIFGHMLWELLVILLILFGLGWVIQGNTRVIYLAGGAVLSLMGFRMLRSKEEGVRMETSRVNSSIGGGILYSAFNPTQPVWWATAGFALLLTGLDIMGMLGVVVVTAGHWLSDMVYYYLVSYTVHKYRRYVNPRQKQMTIVLGVFICILGAYFLIQGVGQLAL